MSDRRNTDRSLERSPLRLWLLVLAPVAACLVGAALGWTVWLPLAALGLGGLAYLFARPSGALLPGARKKLPEPMQDLDCETRFECQALLHQLDRFAQTPAVRDDAARSFYLSHVARLQQLILDLAADRAEIRRLTSGIDEHALRYTAERLRRLAERSGDAETAEMYRRACGVRDRQLELLAKLREVTATGNAHWEHLSAVVEELAAESALMGLRERVQSQETALRRLVDDAEEYRSVVEELGTDLGSNWRQAQGS